MYMCRGVGSYFKEADWILSSLFHFSGIGIAMSGDISLAQKRKKSWCKARADCQLKSIRASLPRVGKWFAGVKWINWTQIISSRESFSVLKISFHVNNWAYLPIHRPFQINETLQGDINSSLRAWIPWLLAFGYLSNQWIPCLEIMCLETWEIYYMTDSINRAKANIIYHLGLSSHDIKNARLQKVAFQFDCKRPLTVTI